MNGGEMTLVFSLAAVDRLARPAAVVADARRWTESVGVVGDAPPDEVRAAVEAAGVDPDFVSGEAGTVGSLAAVRQQFSTDRHVFVGASDEDSERARALGWEYLPVEEAAGEAGWDLTGEESD